MSANSVNYSSNNNLSETGNLSSSNMRSSLHSSLEESQERVDNVARSHLNQASHPHPYLTPSRPVSKREVSSQDQSIPKIYQEEANISPQQSKVEETWYESIIKNLPESLKENKKNTLNQIAKDHKDKGLNEENPGKKKPDSIKKIRDKMSKEFQEMQKANILEKAFIEEILDSQKNNLGMRGMGIVASYMKDKYKDKYKDIIDKKYVNLDYLEENKPILIKGKYLKKDSVGPSHIKTPYLEQDKWLDHLYVCKTPQAFEKALDQLDNVQKGKYAYILSTPIIQNSSEVNSDKRVFDPRHKIVICIEKENGHVKGVLLDSIGNKRLLPRVNRQQEDSRLTTNKPFETDEYLYNLFKQKGWTLFYTQSQRQGERFGCDAFALKDAASFLTNPEFFSQIKMKSDSNGSYGEEDDNYIEEEEIDKNNVTQEMALLPPDLMVGAQHGEEQNEEGLFNIYNNWEDVFGLYAHNYINYEAEYSNNNENVINMSKIPKIAKFYIYDNVNTYNSFKSFYGREFVTEAVKMLTKPNEQNDPKNIQENQAAINKILTNTLLE